MNLKKLIKYGKLRRSDAVAQRCSVKNVFLEILQNSQENTCTRVSFLIKLHALRNFQEHLFLQYTSGGCFWTKFSRLKNMSSIEDNYLEADTGGVV